MLYKPTIIKVCQLVREIVWFGHPRIHFAVFGLDCQSIGVLVRVPQEDLNRS